MFTQEMKDAWNGDLESEKFRSALHNAVKTANFTVYDQAQQFPEFSGMGTTLVAAIVQPKKCVIVNVGDSRAYRINPDGITQITQDHSLVQMMVDRGEITPEQAKVNPSKNLITRAVGTEPAVICDIFPVKLEKGDYLLLCSDGLTNLLDDQEILFEVVHGGQADDCCVRLLEIAKKRGAPDNVTCILVSV
jgi:protein phosphatase